MPSPVRKNTKSIIFAAAGDKVFLAIPLLEPLLFLHLLICKTLFIGIFAVFFHVYLDILIR